MDRIPHFSRRLQRVTWPLFIIGALALALLTAAPAQAQTKRILLVGDSWAQYTWNGNAWSPVLSTYGLSQWDDEGSTTAIGGTTASIWVDPGALDLITQALATYPTIDIIHLSIGGNDMLAGQGGGGWHTGLSGAQESALFDTIQANIDTIVEHCLSIRPDVKVGIIDYDYLNLWETSLAGIQGAQLMQLNLGNPSPTQINGAFTRMGERKRQVAASHDRVLYVQNWGLQQYRHGHPGFWDAGLVFRPAFGSGLSPVPGWPPNYVPYPGGVIEYPGPRAGLDNNGDDPIHLNITGYKDVCSSALGQGFAAWLADTTGPRVQSITRTGASPTDALQVGFLVTFSESVRTVTAGDFALDADPGITGASIVSVTGSGVTRTVTVSRGTGNGLLSIDFVDHDTVYDQNWRPAGDDLNAPSDAEYTNGQAYLIDDEVPGVTLTPAIASPTFLNAVPFTVQFTEPVTGFTSGDIVVTVSSGSGTAQVSAFSGQGAAYTFTLQTAHTTTIVVNVEVAAGVAFDAAGNGNLAETFPGYEFTTPSGLGDPYVSNGSDGNLMAPAFATVAFDTDGVKPSVSVNGGPVNEGEIITISGGEVAKFNFVDVEVPASAIVTVTGLRPLAIAASEDISWDADLDVSGAVPGRAGGGAGGAGGDGGGGGGGGVGGTADGIRGARASGGGGCPNFLTNGGNGYNGTGRNSGTAGGAGSIGSNGGAGDPGTAGTLGFASAGSAGGSGGGGTAGTGATAANGGSAGSASGGEGGGGGVVVAGNGGNGGGASASGVAGGPGNIGAQGGDGGNGISGGDASFTAAAADLTIASGNGGGGGGGGGGGAGGQGGGKGGGGSSGAGGGGGGLSYNSIVAQCSTPVDGAGGNGGYGGAGGNGGNGGTGGSAAAGQSGGTGGAGGGAVVLAARGLLDFGGSAIISAGAPGGGNTVVAAVPGGGGSGGGAVESGAGGGGGAQGAYWVTLAGCWPVLTNGGAGGNGTNGGAGGAGGQGGPSGTSGAGGTGGLGTPGMVKLQGSVILTGGSITAENHTASTANSLKGRATAISNMPGTPLPAYSNDDVLAGATTNDPVLKAPAVYGPSLNVPLIPQLQGGAATAGFTESSFWNQGDVSAPGFDLIELVTLGTGISDFSGFDQIFLVNNGGADAEGVVLFVSGYPGYSIGTIADGERWTTTVPAGSPVTFSIALDVVVAPGTHDIYTGESFLLTATANGGTGSKTYRWLRDGIEVQIGAGNTFEVVAATPADAGTYTVEVTDGLPQTVNSNEAIVTVDDPISITLPPQSVTVAAGDSHVFSIEAAGGKGGLSYDWRLENASIGAPDQPFLLLSAITPAAAGDYTCVVSDHAGAGVPPFGQATSAAAALTVNDPLVVSGPADVSVYVDETTVQFTVLASGGTTPYGYEWYHNGVSLPLVDQPNGPTLNLGGPLTGLGGAYSCAVTDSDVVPEVEVSREAQLTVVDHLSIQTQPLGAARNPGQSMVFAVVTVGGVQPVSYTWRKDSVPLSPAQQPNSPVLTIPSVSEADQGSYDVIATDSGTDSAQSDPAVLNVADSPLDILQQPVGARGYTAPPMALTSIALEVVTSGGIAPVSYLWKKDGQEAPGLNTQASYSVTPAVIGDSGLYTCEVADATGVPVLSEPAVVEIEDHITFTDQPEGGAVSAGESFVFDVVVSGGLGDIEYVWMFESVAKAPQQVGTGDTLTLTNLTVANAGDYYVEVSDDFETFASDIATLDVANAIPVGTLGAGTIATALAALGLVRLRRRR